MLKAGGSPVAVLLLSLLLRLEEPSTRIALSIGFAAAGTALACVGELRFSPLGAAPLL